MYELNSNFINERASRVEKPEETSQIFNLQELIQLVFESNISFYDFCKNFTQYRDLVLSSQAIIDEESNRINDNNLNSLEEIKQELKMEEQKHVNKQDKVKDPFEGLDEIVNGMNDWGFVEKSEQANANVEDLIT